MAFSLCMHPLCVNLVNVAIQREVMATFTLRIQKGLMEGERKGISQLQERFV